jgi:MFS family permease
VGVLPLRKCIRAGLESALVGAAGFTVVHVLILTPYMLPRHEGPLWQVPVGLLGPLIMAIPLSLVAGPAVGLAWHELRIRRELPLHGWRFGALFVAAAVPAFLVSLLLGPFPELPPQPATAMMLALPPAMALGVGLWLGGWRGGIGLLFSMGLIGFMLTPFILAESLFGLPGMFLVAALIVIACCGVFMERRTTGMGDPSMAVATAM